MDPMATPSKKAKLEWHDATGEDDDLMDTHNSQNLSNSVPFDGNRGNALPTQFLTPPRTPDQSGYHRVNIQTNNTLPQPNIFNIPLTPDQSQHQFDTSSLNSSQSSSTYRRGKKRTLARPSRQLKEFVEDARSSSDESSRRSSWSAPASEVNETTYRKSLQSLREIMLKTFNQKNLHLYSNFIINDLDLIIRKLIQDRERREVKMNFNLLAQSLDAGTKLLQLKVEKIDRDTQWLQIHLGIDNDIDANNESDDEEEETNICQRRIRRNKRKNTIVRSVESLNEPLQTILVIDPMFQKHSAAFHEGYTANSLLMFNLQMDSRGLMLFDSKDSLNFDQAIPPPCVPMTAWEDQIFSSGNQSVCPQFKNFEFGKRNLLPVQMISQEHEMDDRNEVEDNYPSNISMPTSTDVQPELPLDNNTFNTNSSTADDYESANEQSQLDTMPFEDIPISNSFFNANYMKNEDFTKKQPKKSVSKRRKPRAKTTGTMLEKVNKYIIEQSIITPCDRDDTKIRVSRYILEHRWTQQSCKNLVDYGFSPSKLKELFCPIQLCPQASSHEQENDDNKSVISIDDICLDEENIPVTATTENRQNNENVANIDIEYAKASTRVNWKRVKQEMWKRLQDQHKDTNTTSNTVANNIASGKEVITTFDNLLQDLSENTRSLHVSNHLVALLHLCNEKNLSLLREREDKVEDPIYICKDQ